MALPPAYSYMLLSQSVGAGYGTTVYPPEGFKWLVRGVFMYFPTSASYIQASLSDSASGHVFYGAAFPAGENNNYLYANVWQVIEGYSGIVPFATNEGTQIYVSGQQLTIE